MYCIYLASQTQNKMKQNVRSATIEMQNSEECRARELDGRLRAGNSEDKRIHSQHLCEQTSEVHASVPLLDPHISVLSFACILSALPPIPHPFEVF